MLSLWNEGPLVAYLSYAKHFVDLYKESLKRNEKRVETNFITERGTSDTQFDDFTNLDVVDFFIQPEDNIASLINRKSAQG